MELEKIKSKFPDAVVSGEENIIHINISNDKIYTCCEYLKNLGYDFLQFLTAIDRQDSLIDLRYYFYSFHHKGKVVVKSSVERKGGRVKSITGIYGTANWHERELYDLFGIIFDGHPDLRRLLLEDDFVGYPLLKDYTSENFVKFPQIPFRTETGQI